MSDNIEDFHPYEEALMLTPERLYLGFNKEEGFVTITFCGAEKETEIGYVLSLDDAKFLQSELKRVRRLAGDSDENL